MSKKSEKPPKTTQKPPRGTHQLPENVRAHYDALRAAGATYSAIVKALGCSSSALSYALNGQYSLRSEWQEKLLSLTMETLSPDKRRKEKAPAKSTKKPEPVTVPKPLRISCASCNDKEGVVCDEPLCVRFRAKPVPKLEPQYLTIPPATAQAAKEILAIPRTPLEHIDAKILEAEMRLRILRELRAELQ